jgi:hypothetical protein
MNLDLYIPIIKRGRDDDNLCGSIVILFIQWKICFWILSCATHFSSQDPFFDLLISMRYVVVCSTSRRLVLSSFSLRSFLRVILFGSVLICFAAPACLH